jgi:hypothetical protein
MLIPLSRTGQITAADCTIRPLARIASGKPRVTPVALEYHPAYRRESLIKFEARMAPLNAC